MCGILCLILNTTSKEDNDTDYLEQSYDNLKPLVENRGPDFSNSKSIVDGNFSIEFFSSVLSLRAPFTPQPLINSNGSIFQFNGELYNDDIKGNDTQYFYERIQQEGILKTLPLLKGEYAFTYYDPKMHVIWFGRDCIGRRSLVLLKNISGFIISSVPLVDDLGINNFEEIPGGVVQCLHLETGKTETFHWNHNSDILQFPYGKVNPDLMKSSNYLNILEQRVSELQKLLYTSVERRVTHIHEYNTKEITSQDHIPSKVAILFSGGLDCTLLAHLTDLIVEPNETIDLLNVAFENPRVGGGYDTPDRKLGIQSFEELESLSLNSSELKSRFRFIKINTPYDELLKHREIVKKLMYPKDSVMDLSIAVAFYFASRGIGVFRAVGGNDDVPYASASKLLISGLGADELFGGYSRHTGLFDLRKKQTIVEYGNAYSKLHDELQMDFGRLHTRNLGRDDRVIGGWGKEARYPFLDEDLIKWAMNCELDLKVFKDRNGDQRKPADSKYILRKLAKKLGFVKVVEEKKRAIQFGARSAKMEIGQGKVKGSDKLV